MSEIKRRATPELLWVPVGFCSQTGKALELALFLPLFHGKGLEETNMYLFSSGRTKDVQISQLQPVNSPFGAGACGLMGSELARVRRLSDNVPFVSE